MNSVNVIGVLKEKVDDRHRYFEYELPFECEGNGGPNKIIVKYWENQDNCRLIVLPDSTRVAIVAHLDAHPQFGTILIVEEFQVLR